MLSWANRFSIFCLLDNQHYHFQEPSFECLLAAGHKTSIELQHGNAFEQLRSFYALNKGEWLFGHLGYDLKNEVEKLQSDNFDGIGFADAYFFVPEFVLKIKDDIVEIQCEGDAGKIYQAICEAAPVSEVPAGKIVIESRIQKEAYIHAVKELQKHILHGDCYEVNFCQEFFGRGVIDPLNLYQQLVAVSPNPFAALYKLHHRYCICASPERYLKKQGHTIISQPIKGTSRRDPEDEMQDAANKKFLLLNEKERSENVMVVDLVRNDLSKVCVEGTVKVDELFGIYSFPQVHQMISTVSGVLKEDVSWVDAVKASFPMGSMTGAPKKKVMELIEQYEQTRRGLFSGAIGYINPAADFDFNVVIRSLLYNAGSNYISFQTGSAITFYSDAAKEYEECLLKAAAIKKVLQ
ncbi:MAG: anthranilate synthase component I family protein [Ferruginibacter sp.]